MVCGLLVSLDFMDALQSKQKMTTSRIPVQLAHNILRWLDMDSSRGDTQPLYFRGVRMCECCFALEHAARSNTWTALLATHTHIQLPSSLHCRLCMHYNYANMPAGALTNQTKHMSGFGHVRVTHRQELMAWPPAMRHLRESWSAFLFANSTRMQHLC